MKLTREFFRQDSYNLAITLLGKVICINEGDQVNKYRIVETEAYGGITDKAAHSYDNKRTKRTEAMYLDGGHVYIYLIYGMYYMLNIVASIKDNPEAVLIRAVEPLNNDNNIKYTNGPGKLCKYLGIDKSFNNLDLLIDDKISIIDDGYLINDDIIYSKRIGVDYAEEDKERLWRFYINNNQYISKK